MLNIQNNFITISFKIRSVLRGIFASLAIVLYLFSFHINAGVVDTYEAERSRILRLDYYQIYDELIKTKVFDLNTALGKHFFNTIISVSHKIESTVEITYTDFKNLTLKFPKFALENEILSVTSSKIGAAKKITQLEDLSLKAQKNGWRRIYRYAIGQIVRFELDDRRTPSALIRMLSIVDEAPLYKVAEMTFDYPLQSVFLDLAYAFNFIGESEKAISYCRMAGDFLPKTSQFFHLITRCKADALQNLKRYKEALQLISQSIEKARAHDESIWLSTGYLFAAEIAFNLGHLNLAENYILDSINIAKINNFEGEDGYFYEYLKLAQLNVQKKNSEKAKSFIKLSEDQSRGRYKNLSWQPTFLTVHADIAELEGDYQSATHYYKVAINELAESNQKIPFNTLLSLMQKFNDLQIRKLNNRNSDQRDHLEKMLLWIFLVLILSIVSLTAFAISLKQKRDSDDLSCYDVHTAIYTRCFATSKIREKRKSCNSSSAIILVEFDTYALETFANEFSIIAKELRYLLNQNDIVGRFSNNSILLYFNDTDFSEAKTKIKNLIKTLSPLKQNKQIMYRYALALLDKEAINKTLKTCQNELKKREFQR